MLGRVGSLICLGALFASGVADEASQLVLALVALVVALGLRLVHGRLRLDWPALALLGVAAFELLQSLPLPRTLLSLVSPQTLEIHARTLALVGEQRDWLAISLDPRATLWSAARLTGLAALYVLISHRARSSERARREILGGLGLGGALLALGFLLSELSGWGASFLVPVHNENHLGGALNVAFFSLLALTVSSSQEKSGGRVLWGTLALVCLAALLRTGSVGAQLSLLAGLVVAGWKLRTLRASGPWRKGALVLVGVLVSGVLWASWTGVEGAAARGKLQPMRAAWSMAWDFPLAGAGAGAFRTLHDRYLEGPAAVTFTHVENEALQAFAELGVVGLLAVLAVCAALVLVLRSGGGDPLSAGVASAAFALLLQSFVDFNLQYSGGYLLVALVAVGLSQSRRRGVVGGAPLVLVAGLGLVCTAFFVSLPAVEEEEAALVEFAQDSAHSLEEVEKKARALLSRRPADYVPAAVLTRRALEEEGGLRTRAAWLSVLLELAPSNPQAHLLAAEALATIGVRGQALDEWRRAAELGAASMERVLRWYSDDASILRAVPHSPREASEAARVLMKSGRRALAVQVVEKASASAGSSIYVDSFYFDLLLLDGRSEEALVLARRLRESAGHWNLMWVHESRALLALGRREEADALLLEALRRLPGDYMLVMHLATLRLDGGQPEGALEALALLSESASAGLKADQARLRAQAFRRLGRTSVAASELELALMLVPSSAELRLELASLWLELNRPEKARKVLAPLPESTRGLRELREKLERKKTPVEAGLLELLESPSP